VAAPDRYTVKTNWYSGAAWTRPVFDMQNLVTPAGGNRPVWIHDASNVQFENFDITRQRIEGAAYGQGGITVNNSTNILLKNCHVHDWIIASPTTTLDSEFGGIISPDSRTLIIDSCEVHAAPVAGTSFYSGTGIRNFGTTRYSKVYDVPNGLLGGGTIHDNEISYIRESYDENLTPPNGRHENGIYLFAGADFFNNTVHNIQAAGAPTVFAAAGWAGVSATIRIYNNLVYSNSTTPVHLNADGMAAGNSATYYVCNNVLRGYNSAITASKKNDNPIGNVYIKNNVLITIGTYPSTVDLEQPVANLEIDYNVYYSAVALDCVLDLPTAARRTFAQSQAIGYNLHSIKTAQALSCNYRPAAASDIGVDQGVALPAAFLLDRVGTARPLGITWDIGAYEYTGVAALPIPNPPTNLRIVGAP
jgi:hypothetical protein